MRTNNTQAEAIASCNVGRMQLWQESVDGSRTSGCAASSSMEFVMPLRTCTKTSHFLVCRATHSFGTA